MTSRDRPLGWGAEAEMNAFETMMWRVESDRKLRSPVCGLEELDTVPDWDRFLAAHEWGVRMVPRFRQRVVEPPLGLGAPRWTEDPDFDLRFHVRRTRLPGGGGWPELLEAAAQVMMTPFDRTRPPWEAVLFEGLPGDRAAYLLKLHHVASDGMGFMQLFSQLHSRTREPNPNKPQPPMVPAEETSPMDALVHQVRHDAEALPDLLRDAGDGALRALRDPGKALRGAHRYGQSLLRVLRPPEAPGSPLLAKRGMTWRFGALDVPFADLKAAGKAANGSVNDAFLAALLGGYRLYHEAMGVQVDAIPMAIPISVRKAGDSEGGNKIASARLSGPVSTKDPRSRIEEVRSVILTARAEPALDTIGAFSPALARLPGPVIAQIAGPMTKGNDLQASNVPGVREDLYLAGAKIERMYPYAPLPGCAAMITMVTHGEVACVGVNYDAASFTEPELFIRCLVDGFAEVLALHPGSASPVSR
ncbi:wax ester/triacylglycerol synthase family O-acyltransferase [Pseudonocardia eucalypti]|uniref:Diacylglycerol O-acyltransferase n=1 Tax=Pseudonocardia eucalypti TaxID=648755 RepID=A0ABP9QB85_9PSEU|nr:WS/DGAT/MGAT family acyltransferase [Pseudonocardia eucalypti]